ncbi:MAG: Lrp/AsnC family transcriptional regulator [Halocynthiibacter sp.]
MSIKIDNIDRQILNELQKRSDLSQRALADKVGLSQNACWRRLKQLEDSGILKGSHARIDGAALGLDLTVFVMVKTRNHSLAWSDKFRRHVEAIAEVQELHRIGGDWDYMLKICCKGMSGYDVVYRRLIDGFELEAVTGYFSMEPIFSDRPLNVF